MSNQMPVPSNDRRLGVLAEVIKRFRLVWQLFRDKRIPLWTKSVLPISLLYLISPLDFVPDVALGLGQLDDLGVILLGMALFVKLCPPEVVEQHRHQIEYGSGANHEQGEVIDSTYRVIDED